jgi:hypothetical protein
MFPNWVVPFLEALRDGGNVSAAARACSITTGTAYGLRQRNADFANDWDNALEDATDTLEAEARRRALQGVEEPVVYQGQLTPLWERDEAGQVVVVEGHPKQLVINGHPQWLTVNKRSDGLLQFLLKGLRKKYGTDTTEISGPGGAPIQMDGTARAARLSALLELARARQTTNNVDDLA